MSLGSVNVGSGDMHSAVYDPAGGERQVAFADELTDKMNKVNPTGSGSLTIGTRAAGSVVGEGSVAIGDGVEASGELAFAFGHGPIASGNGAIALGGFAEASGLTSLAVGSRIDSDYPHTTASGCAAVAFGASAVASGYAALAVGYDVEATGNAAVAFGRETEANWHFAYAEGLMTSASDAAAHAEGHRTVAAKPAQHVSGIANVEDTGNILGHYLGESVGKYVEIIGNGETNSSGTVTKRSNARTLDWDGNERLHGDLYVNCEDDSTGGSKVATETQVNAKYTKPSSGIPASDLASAVQTSLGKADSALQSESDPVFAASPAYGITAQQISGWDGLQSQIDAITSQSDVVDVVGTYAALQAYTKPTYVDDIVKVLVDSTHGNAIAYYRCAAISGTAPGTPTSWTYIGSQGPFYTKSETDNLLGGKEAKGKITISGVEKTANTHTVTIVTNGVESTFLLVGVN